jgi:hypothetical protein
MVRTRSQFLDRFDRPNIANHSSGGENHEGGALHATMPMLLKPLGEARK